MESPARPSRIHVLAPALADQIAAGEVVERPASVVKELCENAVDAGATRVDVQIEAGGRRLIRVVDDGHGMTATEARLALRRHATSKIASADDLWGLPTFGFRGEALPSIAAVSRMTLLTRTREDESGSRLVAEAGIETESNEVGLPPGTQVEIRDLFFNTPARLKFLKTDATETANVSEAVLRLALGHPEVHFRLRSQDRVTLDLPRHRDRAERTRAALARRGASLLHEAVGTESGCHVHAFLASPDEAGSNPRNTFLFVGQRFIRDRSLLSALCMGYGEVLERGRYPMAALFIDVPGPEVDINVHPQKLEVRFARAQEVYGAVRHVLAAAVARSPWLIPAAVRTFSLPPDPRVDLSNEPAVDGAGDGRGKGTILGPGPGLTRPSPSYAPVLPFGGRPGAAPALRDAPDRDHAHAVPTFFARLTFVAQVHATYLLCEGDQELVLVDQHSAHERVVFERLRAAHKRRQMARQGLLFPLKIDIGADRHAAASAALGTDGLLIELGFEAELFGTHTLLLRAVPELLKDADPKPLVLDVLDQAAAGRREPRADSEEVLQILSTLACHSVVRAGDVLPRVQAEALLRQLDDVDLRSHCPHGRPVLLRLPLSEIERRFGRS